jgi:LysR family transcriptional regulator, low CO2-responsive transcriptional regulator
MLVSYSTFDMNLHQLAIFHTVANRLSFTRAAQDLVMTQPAVSLQVKALERSLGLRLFERMNNRLTLTDAGEALLRSAAMMLSVHAEAERMMAEFADARRGKLILGMNTTGGMYLMPPFIRDFRQIYPDTDIVLHIDGTERLCERILQSSVDLAVVGGPIDDPRLAVEHLCLDPLALIVSPVHAFAGRAVVSVAELAAQEFVTAEPNSRTRMLIERSFRERGIVLRVSQQLNGTEAVKKAVEANLGVALVSSHAVDREISAGYLCTASIEGFALERYFEMISRADKYFAPVGLRLKRYLRERCAAE